MKWEIYITPLQDCGMKSDACGHIEVQDICYQCTGAPINKHAKQTCKLWKFDITSLELQLLSRMPNNHQIFWTFCPSVSMVTDAIWHLM